MPTAIVGCYLMRLYALISNLSYQINKAEGGELRGVPRPYAYIG